MRLASASRWLARICPLRYQFQVTQGDYSNAALLLVGHGSSRTPDAAASVYQHGQELRRRGYFRRVVETFWKEEPRAGDVLSAATEDRVLVVPLFISEGYFSERIVPAALGFERGQQGELLRMRGQGRQRFFYCRPVGTHPQMTAAVLARAQAVVQGAPHPRAPAPWEIDLFIAGHGTEQDENSRAAIEHQVELVGALGMYAGVHSVFIEEEPRISRCYEMTRRSNMVVVPFFMSEGLHVQEDIPALLGENQAVVRERRQNGRPAWRNPTRRHGKFVWCARSVGTDPVIADVVMDRVREATENLPLDT